MSFPTVDLLKDDRTDFAQEERTGSSILDHDLGVCVLVDESKNLDILTLGFFNNLGASSILAWVYADTASAACPAHPGGLDITSISLTAVICDADDPFQ